MAKAPARVTNPELVEQLREVVRSGAIVQDRRDEVLALFVEVAARLHPQPPARD